MDDSMPYDLIQGQGVSEVPKIVLFWVYLLHHLQREPANDHCTAQYLNLFGPDF